MGKNKMENKEIKREIVESFKKRTGFKNLLGSVEKVVEELFIDIEKVLVKNENSRFFKTDGKSS